MFTLHPPQSAPHPTTPRPPVPHPAPPPAATPWRLAACAPRRRSGRSACPSSAWTPGRWTHTSRPCLPWSRRWPTTRVRPRTVHPLGSAAQSRNAAHSVPRLDVLRVLFASPSNRGVLRWPGLHVLRGAPAAQAVRAQPQQSFPGSLPRRAAPYLLCNSTPVAQPTCVNAADPFLPQIPRRRPHTAARSAAEPEPQGSLAASWRRPATRLFLPWRGTGGYCRRSAPRP